MTIIDAAKTAYLFAVNMIEGDEACGAIMREERMLFLEPVRESIIHAEEMEFGDTYCKDSNGFRVAPMEAKYIPPVGRGVFRDWA